MIRHTKPKPVVFCFFFFFNWSIGYLVFKDRVLCSLHWSWICYVAENDPELFVLLPPSPEYLDCRPPHLASAAPEIELSYIRSPSELVVFNEQPNKRGAEKCKTPSSCVYCPGPENSLQGHSCLLSQQEKPRSPCSWTQGRGGALPCTLRGAEIMAHLLNILPLPKWILGTIQDSNRQGIQITEQGKQRVGTFVIITMVHTLVP